MCNEIILFFFAGNVTATLLCKQSNFVLVGTDLAHHTFNSPPSSSPIHHYSVRDAIIFSNSFHTGQITHFYFGPSVRSGKR